MRKSRYIIILTTIVIVLALMAGCSKSDRNEEAAALSNEIVIDGLSDVEHAVERVDSAEQAGVFTAVYANTTKAIIYANAVQQRLAAYYAEKAIAAEEGKAVTTSTDSSLYCTSRGILADCLYANGEYGKSITLCKEILAFVGDGTSSEDVTMKCRFCGIGTKICKGGTTVPTSCRTFAVETAKLGCTLAKSRLSAFGLHCFAES